MINSTVNHTINHDSFAGFLPVLLSPMSADDLAKEHQFSVDRLHALDRERYLKGVRVAEGITRVATGNRISLLASSAGADIAYSRDEDELADNVDAANRLVKRLSAMGVDNPVEIVPDYSRTELEQRIADPEVGHILFVGHSNRSTVALPGRPMMWREPGPVDHLKRSIGLLGCGVPSRLGVTPRFGYNLVAPDGVLFGNPSGKTLPRDVPDMGTYSALPTRLMEHSPAIDAHRGM